jgi:sugar lactone lactonase YvrE
MNSICATTPNRVPSVTRFLAARVARSALGFCVTRLKPREDRAHIDFLNRKVLQWVHQFDLPAGKETPWVRRRARRPTQGSRKMAVAGKLSIGNPVCIAASGDKCGEGILWEPDSHCIYWTDINRFLVHRYSVERAELKTWFFSEPVTCVLPTNKSGYLLLVIGSGAMLWQHERDARPEPFFRLPGWPRVRCNDAGIDPRGQLWVGSMRNNVRQDGELSEAGGWDGALYRIDSSGAATEMRCELGISNTLLWSSDDSRFYFGDTLRNLIWSYRYRAEDGSIADEQPFFGGFDRGWPDGSAIDSEGFVWNCRYGGNCIVRVAPNGTIDRVIEMPVSNLTNCTFGGKDRNILYVTSAAPEAGKWERLGGCLFALETNVDGPSCHKFRFQ